MMEKEQVIEVLANLVNEKEKANGLAQGLSEEVIAAYAVINKEQVINYVTNVYDLVKEADLLK